MQCSRQSLNHCMDEPVVHPHHLRTRTAPAPETAGELCTNHRFTQGVVRAHTSLRREARRQSGRHAPPCHGTWRRARRPSSPWTAV